MANSGSIGSSPSVSNRNLTYNWSVERIGRTARIHWSLVGSGSYTGYVMTGPVVLWANGNQLINRSDRFQLWQGTVAGSGYYDIGYDAAGNAVCSVYMEAAISSYANSTWISERSWNIDNIGYQAPTYNSISHSSITRTSVYLSASVNTYGAGITGGGWDVSTDGGATWTYYGGGPTGATISGLTPNKQYWYRGYVTTSGGGANSGWGTFTTSGNAPSISSVTQTPSRTGCSLVPNVVYDTNASYSSITISYGTTTSYGSTSTSQSISGLQPNTKYYYSMVVKDNWNRNSAAYTGEFTTTGNIPVINSVAPTPDRTQCVLNADVTYDTNASFGSVAIQYGTTTGYGSTSNSYTITGLQPHTTYYYSMRVTDNWGRQSGAFTGSFLTIANPPVFTTEEISDIGVEDAKLTFVAEPDLNTLITEYRLFNSNNVLLQTNTTGVFEIIELETDTEYSYYCIVFDNAGNSTTSNTLTFTTLTSKFTYKIQEDGTITAQDIYSIGEPKNFVKHIKLENGGIAFVVDRDYTTACSYSTSTTSMRSELISVQHTTLRKYKALFIKSDFDWKLQYYNKNKLGVYQKTGGPGEGALIAFDDIEGYYAIEINTRDVNALKNGTFLWACGINDLDACMNDTYKIKKRLQKTDIVKVSNKMRYIDIGQNGNYVNAGNHIVELEVYDKTGTNVALGKPVIAKNEGVLSNGERVTNGNTATTDYASIVGRRTIAQVDLGQEYEVDYVRLWRYYQDNRYYKETFLYGRKGSSNLLKGKGLSTPGNDTAYWSSYSSGFLTSQGNGWIKSYTSTPRTTEGYANTMLQIAALENLKPDTTYTIVYDFKDYDFEGSGTFNIGNTASGNTSQFLSNPNISMDGIKNLIDASSNGIGRYIRTIKTKSEPDFSTASMSMRNFITYRVGSMGGVTFRMTLIEGDYTTHPEDIKFQLGDAKELCYKFHDWKRDGEYPETSSGLYVKVNNAPIDEDIPIINSFTANTTYWTNKGVTLTILAQDNFGVDDLIYSFDGGINWTKNNNITVFKNGTYTAVVKDKAGNVSTTNPTINVSNIDMIPPTQPYIQLRYDDLNGDLYDGNWTNRNICIDIKTTDSTNKCPNDMEPGFIDKDTGEDISDNNKIRLYSKILFTRNNSQIYVGRFGNISGVATIYFYDANDTYLGYVDMAENIKDNIVNVPVNTEYARLADTVTDITNYYMIAESDSIVPYEPYYVVYDNLSGIKGWYYKTTPTSEDYVEIIPGTIIDKNSNFKWYIVTRDNAGNNSMAKDIEIKIDIEAPINPRFGYTKTNTSLTLTASGVDDYSGIRGYSFSIDNGQNWTEEQASNVYTFTDLNGMYDAVIKVIDMAGNEAISDFQAINVGTSKDFPVITNISGNPTDWTKDDVTLIITAAIGSGSVPGTTITEYSFDNGRTWSTNNQKSFADNTLVHMMVKDSNGKTSETYLSDIIKIDKIPPSLTIPTEEVTISIGVDYDLTRGVTYYDDESGIDENSLVINPSSTIALGIGENTINYTISDIVGNSTTKTRVINVEGLVPSDALYPRDDLYPEDLPYSNSKLERFTHRELGYKTYKQIKGGSL